MTILLTGGNGRTSSAIARRLNDAKVPFVVLSRSGTAPAPFKACGFDWCDENTYSTPFSQAIAIDALYIVVPIINMDDPASPIIRFIDFAKAKGVKRFVLLSASNVEPGRRIMGDVHQHLISANVDHVVLRPTWYMGTFILAALYTVHSPYREMLARESFLPSLTFRWQKLTFFVAVRSDNFSRNQAHTVVTEGKIYSTVEDGKIPWISSDDVGAVGYHALVDDSVTERELILLGPELLSYDEVRLDSVFHLTI